MKNPIFEHTLQSYISKIAVLAVILLMGTTLNAQVAFYLRPTIIAKTNQSSFGDFLLPNYNTIHNEHFTFMNRSMFFDDNIDFGIHAGIQIKKKHFIEIGYSSDHSSIGNIIITYPTYINIQSGIEYSTEKAGYSSISPNYSRLSVDYQYNFWNNKNETLRLQSISGLGLLFNTSKFNYSSSGTNRPSINDEIGPDVFISEYRQYSSISNGNVLYAKLGLGIDFFTKKDRHLFSLEVSYLQSSRIIQNAENRIQITDNGVETNYLYNQKSRGSGIYFTLSRKFQVYPWIPIVKEKI